MKNYSEVLSERINVRLRLSEGEYFTELINLPALFLDLQGLKKHLL